MIYLLQELKASGSIFGFCALLKRNFSSRDHVNENGSNVVSLEVLIPLARSQRKKEKTHTEKGLRATEYGLCCFLIAVTV